MTTVKDLKDMLKGIPDDTKVVLGCRPDGNYCAFLADVDSVDCDTVSTTVHEYIGGGVYRDKKLNETMVIIWGDEM